jgi:hypothetical protein
VQLGVVERKALYDLVRRGEIIISIKQDISLVNTAVQLSTKNRLQVTIFDALAIVDIHTYRTLENQSQTEHRRRSGSNGDNPDRG